MQYVRNDRGFDVPADLLVGNQGPPRPRLVPPSTPVVEPRDSLLDDEVTGAPLPVAPVGPPDDRSPARRSVDAIRTVRAGDAAEVVSPTLTRRENDVVIAIRDHIERTTTTPTRAQLASALGISTTTLDAHLANLRRKGAVAAAPARGTSHSGDVVCPHCCRMVRVSMAVAVGAGGGAT